MSGGEKEKEKESAVSSAPAEGGGKNQKLVFILTIVNVIATLGIGGITFISFKKESQRQSVSDIDLATDEHGAPKEGEHGAPKAAGAPGGKEEKKSEFGKMIPLDQFTVNVSTPGGTPSQFVRVNFAVALEGEELEAEFTKSVPRVRNIIIDLLNSKKPADLAAPEGREYLKEEIKTAINGFLTSGKISGVYYTSFALGR